jgi:hypothetical protein
VRGEERQEGEARIAWYARVVECVDAADVCLVAVKEGKKRLEKSKTVTRAEVEITTTHQRTPTQSRENSLVTCGGGLRARERRGGATVFRRYKPLRPRTDRHLLDFSNLCRARLIIGSARTSSLIDAPPEPIVDHSRTYNRSQRQLPRRSPSSAPSGYTDKRT